MLFCARVFPRVFSSFGWREVRKCDKYYELLIRRGYLGGRFLEGRVEIVRESRLVQLVSIFCLLINSLFLLTKIQPTFGTVRKSKSEL